MNKLLSLLVGLDDETAREDDSIEHGLPRLLEDWSDSTFDFIAVDLVPKNRILRNCYWFVWEFFIKKNGTHDVGPSILKEEPAVNKAQIVSIVKFLSMSTSTNITPDPMFDPRWTCVLEVL